MHPVFQDVKARTSREDHIDICVIVTKDEVIHIVLTLELRRELIERLVCTFKSIFSVVRQTAVARPGVAQTIGKPRMQHTEQEHLQVRHHDQDKI